MENVRTIFIGGLPPDCTERELHLLFYEGGGCEAVRLQYPQHADPRSRSGRATAFVQFPSRERALAAASFVSGMVYDQADPSSTLRVEMAKQDFRRIPTHNPGYNSGQGMHVVSAKRPRSYMHDSKLSEKDAATLFIGSLGETVSQQELVEFASSQDGFVQVTMKDEGTPRAVAWAQFSTPDFAMGALANLVTLALPSLGRPPNIEAARSNTGERPAPAMLANAPQAGWSGSAGLGGSWSGAAGGTASSTVFLGSLEPQVTESELQMLLTPLEGFTRLTTKGIGNYRGTAWAQFDSPGSAANGLAALQQTPVPSMGRPANAELARADMRGQS